MYTEDIYITAQELPLSERKRLAAMLIGDIRQAAKERGWSRYATTLRYFVNDLNRANIDYLEARPVDYLKKQLNQRIEQAAERAREGLSECSVLGLEIECLIQEIKDRS